MDENLEITTEVLEDEDREASVTEMVIDTAVLANTHHKLLTEEQPQFVEGLVELVAVLLENKLIERPRASRIVGKLRSPLFTVAKADEIMDEYISELEQFDSIEGAFEDLFQEMELDEQPEADEPLQDH